MNAKEQVTRDEIFLATLLVLTSLLLVVCA